MVRRIGATHNHPLVKVVGTRSNLTSVSQVRGLTDSSNNNLHVIDSVSRDVMKTGKPSEIRAASKANRAAVRSVSYAGAYNAAKEHHNPESEARDVTKTLKHSKIRAASKVGPATVTSVSPARLFVDAETRDILKNAKPSDSRLASTTDRAAIKAELEKQKAVREKQEIMLKEQRGAYMKMNKIRSEINAIKEKEAREKVCRKTKNSERVEKKMCFSKNDKERKLTTRETLKRAELRRQTSGSHGERILLKSSNLVPEMRLKASKRDLLFSDGLKQTDNRSSSRTSRDKKPELTPPRTSTKVRRSRDILMIKEPPLAQRKEQKHKGDDQRKKLDEAKECFEEGYRLCWNFQDCHGALKEYRKALLIREGLLGKYHEDTGRTYYWIGRSLCKLKEYDDALVAFSRAQRIFVRVLAKNHKYLIWTEVAMKDTCKEMNSPHMNYTTYKPALDESIAREIKGDTFRKNNLPEKAVVEYRAAIENIQHHHPDSADLHSKIAIILRGMGEFEKALEANKYALEIYELSLGPEHPETVKTLNRTLSKKRLNQVSLALEEKLNLRA
mmetsp:Transcript_32241/g.75795  ORF Transcript_32241/g.75795 Transcript_32241/m.75795 type:complete len:558 (-) Transcript_32241:151-1824(-)|eukprot:CAMPEP_0172407746 /NCGR_PEP_ID=MMETSP1061-20121228/75493_1 /TAXON_ID=37318 /ORGANISM="Pseudo-nitzschia pungens, Strain cf. pungens" /LENGTH=557 /DNA_ID=CAMNT_0013143851 /DNA_START=155 /DNA_END=1828 /DNA_ORIENTATION=-